MDISNLKYYVKRDENGNIVEKVAIASIVKITPRKMGDHYFVNNAKLATKDLIEDSLLNQDVDVPVVHQYYQSPTDGKIPKVKYYPIFEDTGLIGKRRVTSIALVNDLFAVVLNNEHFYSIKVLDMDLSQVPEV